MRPRKLEPALLGALLIALLARAPGVWWGANFPTGWYGHHVDEYTHLVNAEVLITPDRPPRWNHPYPPGLATHAAVPIMIANLVRGRDLHAPVHHGTVIVVGRIASVLYGVASVAVVFFLARRLFRDRRVASLSAWIVALGGLHVSQSHYFVSDVGGLFWTLVASLLLLRDGQRPAEAGGGAVIPWAWLGAAFACGAAFGLKLQVALLPGVAVLALLHRDRWRRAPTALLSFALGLVAVTLGTFTPDELVETFTRGIGDPYVFDWWEGVILYLVELPSIVGFPVIVFGLVGAVSLARRFGALRGVAARPVLWAVLVPLAIQVGLIVFKLDHFPRHLVPLIPWIAMAAAVGLVALVDRWPAARRRPALVLAPFFLYLAAFVFDGERVFLQEPRNAACRWVLDNVPTGSRMHWIYHDWVPGYRFVSFPEQRPPVVVMEMHYANHFLSGMGWRDSDPQDYRRVFDCETAEHLEAMQDLFRGRTEYREVARFAEGYVMPEYRLSHRLLGNRSRNYVAEVVVFERDRGG